MIVPSQDSTMPIGQDGRHIVRLMTIGKQNGPAPWGLQSATEAVETMAWKPYLHLIHDWIGICRF